MRSPWIARLFALSLVPSLAMILMLIVAPSGDVSKCPFFHSPAAELGNISDVSSGDLALFLEGVRFPVNNKRVFSEDDTVPADGSHLVFLGSVFDVRSAAHFYGTEGGYNALASGKDATLKLVTSNLTIQGTDLSGFAKGRLKESIGQWIPLFFHKYPQAGVEAGQFFDRAGIPTEEWLEIADLLKGSGAIRDPGGDHHRPYIPTSPCVWTATNSVVTCESKELLPKIITKSGVGECVCVEEEKLFGGPKSHEFVPVHFAHCDPDQRVCRPGPFEL